ncbi:MAG: hypothetical protein ACQZ3M_03565 [cyanobacterium endosymbiont of Rhopalodia fuxianensis]
MTEEPWENREMMAISIFFNGEGIQTPDVKSTRIIDTSCLLLFNAEENTLKFTLPSYLKN